MTPLLKVITEYCAPLVDDIRLQDKASDNPPVYAWTMWQYLQPQLGRFTIPEEMPEYLFGTEENPRFTEPQFATMRYTVEEDITSQTNISLGEDYAGYELFSCHEIVIGNDCARAESISATYDSESGTVTVNASEDNPIKAGTILEFDFYTDGEFEADLSREVMAILGICFECGWNTRFENDWLSNVPKVEDSSFYQQNIANRMDKGTAKVNFVEQKLAAAMRQYQTSAYYKQIVPMGRRLKIQ